MRGKYKCSKCGSENFKISINPYCKDILDKNHIETYCTECSYGVVSVCNNECCLKPIDKLSKKIKNGN